MRYPHRYTRAIEPALTRIIIGWLARRLVEVAAEVAVAVADQGQCID